MTQDSEFLELLKFGLQELIDFEATLKRNSFSATYARILILYLQCDIPALRKMCQALSEKREEVAAQIGPRETDFLTAMGTLRLRIRERSVDDKTIQVALRAAGDDPGWRGEAFFSIAMAYDVREEPALCKKYNLKAAEELAKTGVRRKSLIARHNAVAAESRIHPNRNLLLDYYRVFRLARQYRERSVAALALNNMAREFQIMGALGSALRYVNKALSYLEKDLGTIQYYLAILNRCHILLELGRRAEAEIDYESAKMAQFPEIKSALEVLRKSFVGIDNASETIPSHLVPTWRERVVPILLGKEGRTQLRVQEDQLVRLIAGGPKTKEELCAGLFGERLSSEVVHNRLKILLYRLNKKRPGLIMVEGGRYALGENVQGQAVSS